jgi:soluble lytic murein transglycosylase-like protein
MASEVKARTETCTEHDPDPVAHSLIYDAKKGKVTTKPVFLEEEAKVPEKPRQNWKLLVIFLAGLAIGCLMAFSLATRAHGAASEAPRIGRLTLPAPWWEIVKQAAQENDLDPCWVVAVMAIESRFYRFAINTMHRCYGLMQLQEDVARGMGVTDPFDAEQNIRAGAKILGRLERAKGGNKRAILKKYNPTDTGAYSREVIKAWRQARRNRDVRVETGRPR